MPIGSGISREHFPFTEHISKILDIGQDSENLERAERLVYRENPILPAERIVFLEQTARIHRRFIKEIMGDDSWGGKGRKAELVVFTGSTYDIAAEPLSVAGYIEGYAAEELPQIASWNSRLYFERHSGGPNSLVYKFVSQDTIAVALENVRNAMVIEISIQTADLKVAETLANGEVSTHAEIMKCIEQIEITDHLFDKLFLAQLFDKGKIKLNVILPEKRQLVRRSLQEVNVAVQVLDHSTGQLHEMRVRLLEMMKGIDSGHYPLGQDEKKPGIDGRAEKNYRVPLGQPRVDLMKALYPEFVGALFNDDGSPKEVVFYDNVSISGEKVNGFLEFFQALGTADTTRIFLMYTKPGAVSDFKFTSTAVTVGKEITENFVLHAVDNPEDLAILDRTHDRVTSLDAPRFNSREDQTTELEKQRKVLLAYHEQLLLPEAVIPLWARADRLKAVVTGGASIDKLTLEYLDNPPLPRIITQTYKDYGLDSYDDFEKTFGYQAPDEREKRYYQDIRIFLDELDDTVTQLPPPGRLRVIILDTSLSLILQSFLRLDRYKNLKDKLTVVGFSEVLKNVDEKVALEPLPTTAVGNTYHSMLYGRGTADFDKFEAAGVHIERMVILADNRREYTPQRRVDDITKSVTNLETAVNRADIIWQQLQAVSAQEISITLAERYRKKGGHIRGSDLPDLRDLLNGGADQFQMDVQDLYTLKNELENGELTKDQVISQVIESDKYKIYEKDMIDLANWGVQLWDAILTELESITLLKGREELQIWENAVLRFRAIQTQFGKIEQLAAIFDSCGLSLSYGEKYSRVGKPIDSTSFFDFFTDMKYAFYKNALNYSEELSSALHHQYAEDYFEGNQFTQVVLQNSSPSSWYFAPQIYEGDLRTREGLISETIEYSRKIERLRYLTEVIAFQPLIDEEGNVSS